jgi:XTP/dITP diphosphohydrolase
MRKLLIATANPGKVDEIRALLSHMPGIELMTPPDVGVDIDVAEIGSSYAENAVLKAVAFARASGLPSLADDSGLEVEALGGAPGMYSARYAPQANANDADRRAYLLEQLAGKARPWAAVFRSTVCIAIPDGATYFAEGECPGEIIPEERGRGGFGYDPIFLVADLGRTMAELSMAEKNELSHRARAILAAKAQLRQLLAAGV